MTLGAWRHADEPPPPIRMTDHMSDESRGLWRLLTGWLAETYHLDGETAWEGSETGWVLRFRRNGRPMVTLSPTADGGFGALVVLGPSLWEAVAMAKLEDRTREAFEFATAYTDGRWLWLRVHDRETVDDICTLVSIKAQPPRRKIAGEQERTPVLAG